MILKEIQVATIGAIIAIEVVDANGVPISIAGATQLRILLGKPNGTVVTKAGVYKTDGTDGIVQYVTVAGDLDQCGWWSAQANIQFSGGTLDYWSVTVNFKVLPNLVSI
jgi:hypothetical protein